MDFPEDLKYTKNDEWIRVDGDEGTVGITDYAQDQLSDIVYLEINVSEGDTVQQGETFGTVESVKAASDIYAPASGEVIAVNEDLADTPELVNTDPYGQAWMLKFRLADLAELDTLMDVDAYRAYCEERES